MTVLVFDGRTLAADKLACSGGTRGTVTKIFRVHECLVGVTGNLSVGMDMLNWFRDGADPVKYPVGNRDPNEGASLVVVHPDYTVWKYESSPSPFQIEDAFCAFGCGDGQALVAMACGRSAVEAVELVSRYNTGCGQGIDALSFDDLLH